MTRTMGEMTTGIEGLCVLDRTRNALFIVLALSATALLAGCGLTDASDEPLPTFEELRAAYSEQELGTGTVREGGNFRSGGYAVTATFREVGEGELRAVFFSLSRVSSPVGIGIDLARPSGIGVTDLEAGMGLEASFAYGGEGDGKRGSGRFYVTAVAEGRVAGVFAADLVPGGLVPDYLRITGSFNATLAED